MSTNAAATPTSYASAATPAKPSPVRRSFIRQALRDTFGQAGARFGAIWIGLLVLAALLAPFVATSHPILMKSGGSWSSPLWQHLTGVDLALVVVASAVIASVIRPRAWRVLTITAALLCIAVLSLKSIPNTVDYTRYRTLERAGKVESAYRTLIPYSATDRMSDMPERRLTAPSRTNWLGTNANGEDLLSGIIHATRIALSIGLIATSISIVIGILVGGLMGYYVGKVDLVGMRLIEIFEAIPALLLLITIMASYGRSIYLMMAVIGLLGWTGTARFVRAEFLRLRNQDFVQAAIATGVSQFGIIYRHIMPNAITPVLVTATFGVASAILTESTLSFLGLGLIDQPSWGRMLNDARSGGAGFVWWMAIFPGLAIFLTVFAYALIGDSMRDALDPKLRKRE